MASGGRRPWGRRRARPAPPNPGARARWPGACARLGHAGGDGCRPGRVPPASGGEDHRHTDPVAVLHLVGQGADVSQVEIALSLEAHVLADEQGFLGRQRDDADVLPCRRGIAPAAQCPLSSSFGTLRSPLEAPLTGQSWRPWVGVWSSVSIQDRASGRSVPGAGRQRLGRHWRRPDT